ncbi:hypothetical protein HETIRDRAFT_436607 [Heterobasidion irregulare TC 32-1]|uniref:Uncharacterized protein n=1 Tax=Heterobasidion irregulare (strain TC 32-1) TaxID=747525 RepID=W4JUJ0_HETIT|nr:uncharacterized protein HETIRDRAFT_436607 [Heterobasidion irregulare TC 32-1]ETW76745.1 hypothetical protein HETIRDRAFT_436607 [Heterobasidion irregulare TC 32-1]
MSQVATTPLLRELDRSQRTPSTIALQCSSMALSETWKPEFTSVRACGTVLKMKRSSRFHSTVRICMRELEVLGTDEKID